MTIVRHIIDPATGQAFFVTPDNPSTIGLDGPIGSLANMAGGGRLFSKFGAAVTDWQEFAPVTTGGVVNSVFGRTGNVIAQSGDYDWSQIAGKPSTFPPSAHTHAWATDITGKPTTIGGYGITDFNSLGDARYSLLGHTHTFASLTSKPTTIGGYGITDFNSLGDARWFLKGSNINLSGSINPYVGFNDGTYTAYWQMVSGDIGLYHNGTNRIIALHGGGQQSYGQWQFIKADGSANIFIVAESGLTSGVPLTVVGSIESTTGSVVVPNGQGFYARRTTGNATIRCMGYDAGTNDLSVVLGGSILRWRDTGSGVPMSLTSGGALDVLSQYKLAGVLLATSASSYNLLYRRDGVAGIYLGGADPNNYYDNTAHIFRDRVGTILAAIQSGGTTLYGSTALKGDGLGLYLSPVTTDAGVYIGFYNSNGGSRRAYIGLGADSGSTADLYVNSDSGIVRIMANGGNSVIGFGTSGIVANYSITSPGFVDSVTGAKIAPVIVSTSAPSTSAPNGTLWVQVT